jgi:hypothetical protein
MTSEHLAMDEVTEFFFKGRQFSSNAYLGNRCFGIKIYKLCDMSSYM